MSRNSRYSAFRSVFGATCLGLQWFSSSVGFGTTARLRPRKNMPGSGVSSELGRCYDTLASVTGPRGVGPNTAHPDVGPLASVLPWRGALATGIHAISSCRGGGTDSELPISADFISMDSKQQGYGPIQRKPADMVRLFHKHGNHRLPSGVWFFCTWLTRSLYLFTMSLRSLTSSLYFLTNSSRWATSSFMAWFCF
jgi:hypothetical protein